MKNKGFTLIELLAVIVILAVIATIATPSIIKVLNSAREGSIKSSALGYIKAVEQELATRVIENNKLDSGTYSITTFNPPLSGLKPSSGLITVDENQTVGNASLCILNKKVDYDGNIPIIDNVNDCSAIAINSSIYLDYVYMPEDGVSTEIYISTSKEVYASSYSGARVVPLKVNGISNAKKIYENGVVLTENGNLYVIQPSDQSHELIETNVLNYYVARNSIYQNSYILMNDNTIKTFNLDGDTEVVSGLTNVNKIVAGINLNFAILNDGTVKGWGIDSYDNPYVDSATPVTVAGLTNVKDIYFYEYCTSYTCDSSFVNASVFVIKNDGSVTVWGYNDTGVLGLGNTSFITTPVNNPNLSDIKEVMITAGTDLQSYAVTNTGDIYIWGRINGAHSSQEYITSPRLIDLDISIDYLVPDISIFETYPKSLSGFMTTSGQFYYDKTRVFEDPTRLWELLQDGVVLPSNLSQYQDEVDCHASSADVYDGFSCYAAFDDEEFEELFTYYDSLLYVNAKQISYLVFEKESNYIVKEIRANKIVTLDGVKYGWTNGTINNDPE